MDLARCLEDLLRMLTPTTPAGENGFFGRLTPLSLRKGSKKTPMMRGLHDSFLTRS